MKLYYIIFSLLLLVGCHPGPHKGLDLSKENKEIFGDKMKMKKTVSLTRIQEELAHKDTVFTSTVGDVSKVCQNKGCWMTIKPFDSEEPVFMVKFKDYGFFMPKDISGDKVIVQGKAFRQITDVETLKHYAMDAGKSKEDIAAITEPTEEWIFIADAVELYREKN